MEARVVARVASAAAASAVAALALTLYFTLPPPVYPVYAAGEYWGNVTPTWILFAAHALGATVLVLGMLSDLCTTPRDTTFWVYTGTALFGSLSSLLVASNVQSIISIFVAPASIALLFAALMGTAETVWDNEASRTRGAIGWGSTPSAHAMWALWATAAVGAAIVLFLSVLSGVVSSSALAARVLFPIAAVWWVPALVSCEGVVYATDSSYNGRNVRSRPVRQIALTAAFCAYSIAMVVFESVGR